MIEILAMTAHIRLSEGNRTWQWRGKRTDSPAQVRGHRPGGTAFANPDDGIALVTACRSETG